MTKSIEDARLVSEGRRAARSGRGRELRLAAQLAQADVARVCLVGESTVNKWEAGVRQPSTDAARLYAQLLRRLEEDLAAVAS